MKHKDSKMDKMLRRVWRLDLYDNYFQDIKNGIKTFEIRRNRKALYEIGDCINFQNLETCERVYKKITYINYTKDIYPGTDLVVLGLGNIDWEEE